MSVYLTIHAQSGATLDEINYIVERHESVTGPLVDMSTLGNESLFKFQAGNPVDPPYAVVSKMQEGADGGAATVCSGPIWLEYHTTPCIATRAGD